MQSTNKLIYKIYKILSLKRKYEPILLFFFIILTSILEILTIGIFFPLVSILISGKNSLSNLTILNQNSSFNQIMKDLGENELIIFSLIIFSGIFIIKNLLVIYFNWYREKFNYSLRNKLSVSIFQNHILKQTSFFFKRNSSEYTSQALMQSSYAVDSVNAFILLINEITVFLFIFLLLSSFNLEITIISVVFFSIFFIPFFFISKQKIERWASSKLINDKDQLKNINESFSMFKYIKIHNLEKNFFEQFKTNNYFCNHYAKLISFLHILPRYSLEILTIILISFIIFFFLINNQKPIDALPLIAIFLLASSRLLPSINKITTSLQTFLAGIPSINSITKEIKIKNNSFKEKNYAYSSFKSLRLNNASFSYNKNTTVFKNLNLIINRGDKIIIKGPSGAGKSSLIETILGLRKINLGKFYLNGKKIDNFNLYSKIKFNYLPQVSYLLDDTIKNNIILKNENISSEELKQIINICQLSEFISKLKLKENTLTGENGVSLSGGQKQRICLARALADRPSFLILDESMNAIDINTENLILKKIIKYNKNLTVIMVTHRKTNSKFFNKIIDMDYKKMKVRINYV